MAIEGILITLEQVTEKANTLRSLNQQLTERLGEITREMKGLKDSWHSEASDKIQGKFEAFQPRFDTYKEKVDSYAAFLDEVVRQYGQTETLNNSNADKFN